MAGQFHILRREAILCPKPHPIMLEEAAVPDPKNDGHLAAVYAAKQPGEIARIYDEWAETYDTEMSTVGYRHPSICLALLARHLPRGAAPLLDAGAGTGLIGEWLAIMGYPHVEALDISAGMLAKAKAKNAYSAFHQLALGSPLPFANGTFAGIISAGVFTSGHVGTEGLGELIRICRPDGVIVLTVKDALWAASFSPHLEELVQSGQIAYAEETAPYLSMPGETDTSPSRGLVLRVLAQD